MEFLMLVMLLALGIYLLKTSEQKKRIALLASYLGRYRIERLMQTLTEGYLRALDEDDAHRRQQIWNRLAETEIQLCDQFYAFVAEFSKVNEADARVSRFPLALPLMTKLFPAATFDLRKAFIIHAQGMENAARNSAQRVPKEKAYILSAELFLLQHSCHWFCQSKAVASARMLVRHQTSYELVLASVGPETRKAYCALINA